MGFSMITELPSVADETQEERTIIIEIVGGVPARPLSLALYNCNGNNTSY
jgi:hypothetical protein